MRNINEISKKLKMEFVNWEGIITFLNSGWRKIPIKISDEILNYNLTNKNITDIVKMIKKEINTNEYKQWSIMSDNILVVRKK